MDLERFCSNPIRNYVLPFLTSHQINSAQILHMEHNQHGSIAPHNHRSDLFFVVLRGYVWNTIFSKSEAGLEYRVFISKYMGSPGLYQQEPAEWERYRRETTAYTAGSTFAMKHSEIHTIDFAPDTMLLRIRGTEVSQDSLVLNPVKDGYKSPDITEVKDWMFK